MNTMNIPTVDITDLPPSQDNPILKFIKHQYVIQHLVGFGVGLLVVFFVVAPLLIGLLFPYFGIMNNYDRVIDCSDSAVDSKNAALFQPVQCSALTGKSVIGCAITANGGFAAPNNAKADQKILCPQLIASPLADGTTNTSVPILSTPEATVKLHIALSTSLAMLLVYISTRIVIHFATKAKQAIF